jgi:hypothetical protein
MVMDYWGRELQFSLDTGVMSKEKMVEELGNNWLI